MRLPAIALLATCPLLAANYSITSKHVHEAKALRYKLDIYFPIISSPSHQSAAGILNQLLVAQVTAVVAEVRSLK